MAGHRRAQAVAGALSRMMGREYEYANNYKNWRVSNRVDIC